MLTDTELAIATLDALYQTFAGRTDISTTGLTLLLRTRLRLQDVTLPARTACPYCEHEMSYYVLNHRICSVCRDALVEQVKEIA